MALCFSSTVLDINDNGPEFSAATYELSLAENTDTVEFSITARDRDTGSNADITFEFINGSANNAFVIGEFRQTCVSQFIDHSLLRP